MTLSKTVDGEKLTIAIIGTLDTATAPKLEEEVMASTKGIHSLVLDLAQLEYVSSAGLRVLLKAQKMMNKQGDMIIVNASETIKEVFELTGFIDILKLG